MDTKTIIKKLADLASRLDKKAAYEEADAIDDIMEMLKDTLGKNDDVMVIELEPVELEAEECEECEECGHKYKDEKMEKLMEEAKEYFEQDDVEDEEDNADDVQVHVGDPTVELSPITVPLNEEPVILPPTTVNLNQPKQASVDYKQQLMDLFNDL